MENGSSISSLAPAPYYHSARDVVEISDSKLMKPPFGYWRTESATRQPNLQQGSKKDNLAFGCKC
jgi:hypothetical protein